MTLPKRLCGFTAADHLGRPSLTAAATQTTFKDLNISRMR